MTNYLPLSLPSAPQCISQIHYEEIPSHHTNLEGWPWLISVSLRQGCFETQDYQQVRWAIGVLHITFQTVRHANNVLDY
jgi:hypothetical protein